MVTLSWVITAWGGMSTTSTRKLTLTTRSTAGNLTTTIPGPFAPDRTLPRRKKTPRSYSVTTTRTDLITMATTTRPATMAMATAPPDDTLASSMPTVSSVTSVSSGIRRREDRRKQAAVIGDHHRQPLS